MEINDQEENGLSELITVLIRFKISILSTTLAVFFLAIVYSFVTPSSYEARLLMVPNTDRDSSGSMGDLSGGLGGLAGLAGVSLGGQDTQTLQSLAKLQSRTYINKFLIENNYLMFLFPDRWDMESKNWIEETPRPWEVYEEATKRFSVSTNKNTGIITVIVEHENAEFAALWANGAISMVNNEIRSEAIEESERSIKYLRQKLDETNLKNIQMVFYNLIEQQTQNIMLASIRDEYAFEIIDPAIVPETSSKPRRTTNIIIGFVIGFLLGIFVALLRNFLEKEKIKQGNNL